MVISNAALLIALDAVVLDTETTGLDPTSARIVEIGAVRLVGGRVEPANSFQRLVRPDVPIPSASTAIHQVDDAKVANASRFAEVWPELSEYLVNQSCLVTRSDLISRYSSANVTGRNCVSAMAHA